MLDVVFTQNVLGSSEGEKQASCLANLCEKTSSNHYTECAANVMYSSFSQEIKPVSYSLSVIGSDKGLQGFNIDLTQFCLHALWAVT